MSRPPKNMAISVRDRLTVARACPGVSKHFIGDCQPRPADLWIGATAGQ